MSASVDTEIEKVDNRIFNPGRDSILDTRPEIVAQIGENIKIGMPRKYAVTSCGIDFSTFCKWMTRGEKLSEDAIVAPEEEKYVNFFNFVKACEADSIRIVLEDINTARKEGAWQAGAWLLERRFPEEFGKKDVKVAANVTGNVTIVIGSNDFEESEEPINVGSNKKLLEE